MQPKLGRGFILPISFRDGRANLTSGGRARLEGVRRAREVEILPAKSIQQRLQLSWERLIIVYAVVEWRLMGSDGLSVAE